MTSTAASNLAAMAAAMKGNDEFGSGTLASHRRSLPSKANGLGNGTTSMERNMNGSLNEALDTANHFRNAEADLDYENAMESVDIAIRDGPSLADTASNNTKPRGRRASEGSHLTKGEGKRASGELRCEKCGKGYKHSSCLTKHLSVAPTPTILHTFSSSWIPHSFNAQISLAIDSPLDQSLHRLLQRTLLTL